MALNDFKDTNQGGVLTVSNSNIGKGIKWNPDTKQYEVDIVDLTTKLTQLEEQVNTLGSKEDKDTVYDDTSLRNELTSLRALVDSIQNTGTTPNAKYFKVPISVSFSEYAGGGNSGINASYKDYIHCSVSYTINENVNNIQAIECIGSIIGSNRGSSYGKGVSGNIPLHITNKNGTSILVEGTSTYVIDNQAFPSGMNPTGYGLIILYLK